MPFPSGQPRQESFRSTSDEMLFIQDPHDLYKHWPADVWSAIDNHQVKPGMNELQADFAIGMGMPDKSSDSSVRTLHYPNGGNPLIVVFRNAKAAEITPGS